MKPVRTFSGYVGDMAVIMEDIRNNDPSISEYFVRYQIWANSIRTQYERSKNFFADSDVANYTEATFGLHGSDKSLTEQEAYARVEQFLGLPEYVAWDGQGRDNSFAPVPELSVQNRYTVGIFQIEYVSDNKRRDMNMCFVGLPYPSPDPKGAVAFYRMAGGPIERLVKEQRLPFVSDYFYEWTQ